MLFEEAKYYLKIAKTEVIELAVWVTGKACIGADNKTGQFKIPQDLFFQGDQCLLFAFVASVDTDGQGNPGIIHEQSHLDKGNSYSFSLSACR